MNTPDIARLRGLAEQLRGIIYGEEVLDEAANAIDALLDRLERAEGGWQDIATAPRDGRHVLLWVAHPNAEYATEKADWLGPAVGRWIGHNGGGWTWYGMFGAPTHWCPIAAPPLDSNRIEGV